MSNEGGDLITRTYSNFRGVDFSGNNVALYRSPDILNIWKNYKSLGKNVETRPDIELYKSLSNTIYGLFFYTINTVEHMIIHCGVSLHDYNMNTEEMTTIKASGMNPRRSESFIFNNIFYIKDGLNYLEYDGETCTVVEGYVPTTTISRNPSGGGTTLEDVNLLSKYRKNSFCADGTSTQYVLDTQNIEAGSVRVWINDVEINTGFTVDTVNGKVTFATAPQEPLTDGQDNVVILFAKPVAGYKDRICKCTLLCVFDNKVFFSGNQDYPNTIFHSSLNNPRYISDQDFYTEGIDTAKVKAMVAGNNALLVLKEPSQGNTTIFYHNPAVEGENKIYPSVHSNISTGCVATAINFNDDIVFFSDRGMEGISGEITTEQVISHRSSLVDRKLLTEENYKNMILQEFEEYLLVIIDKHIYLANSQQMFTNETHNEYEWFYWELASDITFATVKDGILYLCSNNSIYTLTDEEADINAYLVTCEDNFGKPHMQKTTNKKGCIVDLEGQELKIEVKTDNNAFELVGDYTNTKGYIVPRIKKKKWKDIQIKFSSNKHFKLTSCTLQSFVGSYVKR